MSISNHAHEQAGARVGIGIQTLRSIVISELLHVVIYEEKRAKARKSYDGTLKKYKKSHIVYKLFFSWKANYWFVALQNKETGRVITVHPVHFQPSKRHAQPEHLVLAVARTFPQLTYQGG